VDGVTVYDKEDLQESKSVYKDIYIYIIPNVFLLFLFLYLS